MFGDISDEDGNIFSFDKDIELIMEVINEVKSKFPQFQLIIIANTLKIFSPQRVFDYFFEVIQLIKKNPNARKIIKGFDLVTEEDLNYQLSYYTETFIKIEELKKQEGIDVSWVFHVGESLNFSNTNLFEALIFNTKRIGHGLNLAKHSYLLNIIKDRDICIEANPLSNQVLQYTYDLKAHPLITFFNYGLKVSINPDSNGFYGSQCINDDFFVVAACMEFDLKGLKKLCLNSLECSLLDEENKQVAIENWNNKWKDFIVYIESLIIE